MKSNIDTTTEQEKELPQRLTPAVILITIAMLQLARMIPQVTVSNSVRRLCAHSLPTRCLGPWLKDIAACSLACRGALCRTYTQPLIHVLVTAMLTTMITIVRTTQVQGQLR